MKKNLLFSLVILSLFINGCTSYSITKYFDKEEFYNKAIQYTKKDDIKVDDNIKVMMNATYLNSVEDEFDNNMQNFVVGIYIVNDEQELGLKNKEYVLLLNEKEATSIKKLSIDETLTQHIPLKNNWAQYYFVSFEKEEVSFLEEENHNLILSYENIKEREEYLEQKELEEEELKNKSLFEETEPTTLVQSLKASVTFLKEL